MRLKAFVFDLDGTLLHTFPDLAKAANKALDHMGFPARTYDELLAFMGYGGRWLIEQAVPADNSLRPLNIIATLLGVTRYRDA